MIKSGDIDKKLDHVDPNIKDLLVKMLKFNPSHRYTAEDCINHPIFD